MQKSRWAVLCALAASLLLIGASLAQGTPSILWSAIAGGGGRTTADAVTLDSAIGQWTAQGGAQINSGFLAGVAPAPAATATPTPTATATATWTPTPTSTPTATPTPTWAVKLYLPLVLKGYGGP